MVRLTKALLVEEEVTIRAAQLHALLEEKKESKVGLPPALLHCPHLPAPALLLTVSSTVAISPVSCTVAISPVSSTMSRVQ